MNNEIVLDLINFFFLNIVFIHLWRLYVCMFAWRGQSNTMIISRNNENRQTVDFASVPFACGKSMINTLATPFPITSMPQYLMEKWVGE